MFVMARWLGLSAKLSVENGCGCLDREQLRETASAEQQAFRVQTFLVCSVE